jgi:DNA-directed RNA polymerase subunit M
MEFCKKCGGVLVPKKDGGKVNYNCRNCGAKSSTGADLVLKEKVEKKEKIISVSDKKEDLPITDAICDKCGNEKAYWWMQQTRSIDEPPTRFFRCTECSHSWREYS